MVGFLLDVIPLLFFVKTNFTIIPTFRYPKTHFSNIPAFQHSKWEEAPNLYPNFSLIFMQDSVNKIFDQPPGENI